MTTYRAYRLDSHRRIKTGAWVDASTDAEAKAQAQEFCDDDTPIVEVWRGTRLVDEIECEDDEG